VIETGFKNLQKVKNNNNNNNKNNNKKKKKRNTNSTNDEYENFGHWTYQLK
jgi:hypothetical protein